MREVIVPQGSDEEFEITCKDRDGNLFDLSVGYTNIVIIVFNANKSVLEKFSVLAEAGWGTIDTSNAAAGKLSFKLLTSVTNLATEGKKYIEVRLQKTDGTIEDGIFDTISTDTYLCTIVKSRSVNLTLPS
jgi:hypothetical protein